MRLLHTATINGEPVRFFEAPGPQVDLPYHVVEDLHAAMSLPRSLRRHYLASVAKSKKWAGDLRLVEVDEKIVHAGPHYMAQGFIGSMIETRIISADFADAYSLAMADAYKAEAVMLGLKPHEFTTRLFQAATGRPPEGLVTRINMDTGTPVVSARDVQRAFGWSDEQMRDELSKLSAADLKEVDPSRLATIQ